MKPPSFPSGIRPKKNDTFKTNIIEKGARKTSIGAVRMAYTNANNFIKKQNSFQSLEIINGIKGRGPVSSRPITAGQNPKSTSNLNRNTSQTRKYFPKTGSCSGAWLS